MNISQAGTFLDIKFIPKISYGTEFVLESKTNITRSKNGLEIRQSYQSRPQKSFNIIFSRLKPSEVSEIISFFEITKGGLNSFRFKDDTNYSVQNQPLLQNDDNSFVFSLVQVSKILDSSGNIKSLYKNITKPVKDNVTIYDSGNVVNSSNYTINYSTGVVTFTSPKQQANLTASFEFDTHVRLDNDLVSFKNSGSFFEASTPIRLLEILE